MSRSTKKSNLTCVVGCAGIGVGNWGLQFVGFKTLVAIERNQNFAIAYILNYPKVKVLNQDIRDVDNLTLMKSLKLRRYDLDLLQVSPSCKNFSVAKNDAKETLEDLQVAESVAIQVTFFKPKSILIEQVTAYAKSESWKLLKGYLLPDYNIKEFKLNAADYGTPQYRVRFFVIAIRKDIGLPPEQIPPTQPRRTWWEAIEDLISEDALIPAKQGLAPWQLERLRSMSAIDSALLLSGGQPNTTRFRGKGDISFCLVSNRRQALYHRVFLVERVGTHGKGLRTWLDNTQAPTIRALGSDHHWHKFSVVLTDNNTESIESLIENGYAFAVTPRCLARLMGLPDDFKLSGNNPVDAEGLGNGVAVEVIEAIACQIKNILIDE